VFDALVRAGVSFVETAAVSAGALPEAVPGCLNRLLDCFFHDRFFGAAFFAGAFFATAFFGFAFFAAAFFGADFFVAAFFDAMS
jgi:hypothetical protein